MTNFAVSSNRSVAKSSWVVSRVGVLASLCLVLSLAAGNRWLGWGKDYENYLAAYNIISPTFLFGSTRFEVGYELVSWISAVLLGYPYHYLYIILCFVALSIKFYLFHRYLKSPLTAAIAYILIFYPIHEYTQIRAAVAIAFGFLAIHCLMQHRWIPWLLLSIAAVCFHFSAVVLVVVSGTAYFIPRWIGLAAIPAAAAAVAIVAIILGDAFGDLISTINPLVFRYLENTSAQDIVNIFSLSNILIAFTTVLMIVFRFIKIDDYNFVFIFMIIIGLFCIIILRNSPVLALRTSEMLMLATIFAGFRLPLDHQTIYVRSLILINGCWLAFRAFSEGTLG